MVIIVCNYTQYYKYTTSIFHWPWRPASCLGAGILDRMEPHSQDLFQHSQQEGSHRHQAMGMVQDKDRAGNPPEGSLFLPSSSVFPVYIKVHCFPPCILKCQHASRLFNWIQQFSLNDDSVLPNIGSVLLFFQPKVWMNPYLLLISRSLVN